MNDQELARAQKLGELIKNAREHAARSHDECAIVLKISAEEFGQIENGEHSISLPDLEALALFLNVPMGYFWGRDGLDRKLTSGDYANMISLRQRMIGVLLRQLRLRTRTPIDELAAALDVEQSKIEAYEMGQEPVPYLHLEKLCHKMEATVDYFVDAEHGPLGRHESEQKLQKQFQDMPPDMQTFLTNPINIRYLETAKMLSEMDVDKLRLVAESILNITF